MSWEDVETRLKDVARRAGVRDVPPSVLAAAVALAVFAIAWGAWRWWPRTSAPPSGSGSTVVESQSSLGSSAAASPVAGIGAQPATITVLVHVVGAVRHPGVYDLPAGSRVIDAVDAAGGPLRNAAVASVNLARPVTDGEQIAVPDADQAAKGATAPGTAASGAGSGLAPQQAGALVDINSADAALLDTLPGVGPSTAAKIVADREASGPYASVDDLSRVSGIGPKKLEQLKVLACVR